MILKDYLNATIQISLVVWLLSTALLVKPELFNGIVTGKQYGLELAAVCVAGYLIIFLPFRKSIRVTRVDAGIVILCLWFLLSEIINAFPFVTIEHTVFSIGLYGAIYLFVRHSSGKPVFVWGVSCIWLVMILIQTLTGLMQLYGRIVSHHYLFNITGTFHNPGPFAGYIVSALPLALGMVLTLKQADFPEKKYSSLRLLGRQINHKGWEFYLQNAGINLCYVVIVALLLVIPAARSRAAWIAGAAGCMYVLWKHPGIANYRIKVISIFKRMSFFLRLTILAFIAILLLSSATLLYLMKQGSASGRVLMWQVTWELVKEKPLLGHGNGSFNALYMPAQAKWFESGKGNEAQTIVAGSPQAPFNEPLGLLLEKGLIGILIVAGILFLILYPGSVKSTRASLVKNIHSQNIPISTRVALKGTLLTILVFGMFSYPFDISSFVLQLVVITALLGGFSKTVFLIVPGKWSMRLIGMFVAMALLALTTFFVPHRMNHYQALKTWQKAERLYNIRSYNASVNEYEKAYPVLSGNGLFLQMYSKALSMDEQHQRSLDILTLAGNLYNSHILQNTLGDNHKALGNYKAAEAAYIKSSYMMPYTLLPRYLLTKLYYESGQHEKARQVAEELLKSPVKVESTAVNEIKGEMESLLLQMESKTKPVID